MLLTILVATVTVVARVQADFVVCEGLGTFSDDPPFDRLPVPHCPEELGIDLHLEYFNRDSLIGESVVGTDRTTIPNNWSPTRNTVYAIHGWTNDVDAIWLEAFKDKHLDAFDLNVVVVGWGGPQGAGDLNYQKSASTTRTIGAHVGEVIQNLIANGGGNSNQFQIIGHSLGAHVSGHAGRWLNTTFGTYIRRVTGMDPAGPEFSTVDDRKVGLWTDCAVFVDAINTDSLYGSTPVNTGHQNYYPNGGIDQPGCGTVDSLCSHIRVIDLYEESLENTCLFAAREKCDDSSNLPESCNNCIGVCGALGYPAELGNYDNGVYYLETASNNPFCQG